MSVTVQSGYRQPGARPRVLVGLAACAAAVPYLTLKVAWVAGSTVGMADPSVFDNATYRVANALTLLADATAIALALALTFPWGQRLPSWVVLFPMWIASGLLGPIAVLVLVTPLTFALRKGDASGGGGGGSEALSGWVVPMVYGGFAIQGVLILVAFLWYARRRWPGLFAPATSAVTGGDSSSWVRVALVGTGVALATLTGLVNLAWGAGVRAGLDGLTPPQATARQPMFAIFGLFALATVAGVALLHRYRRAGRPCWSPAALVMAGTGSMFAWGLYMLATVVAGPAPSALAVDVVNVVRVAAAVLVVAGLRPLGRLADGAARWEHTAKRHR